MTARKVTRRIRAILLVLGDILWRSFGLFWVYLGGGGLVGGVAMFVTSDPTNLAVGLLSGWAGAALQAYREIGKEIALTSKVTNAGINRGFRAAVEAIEEAQEKQDQAGNN